MKRTAVSLAALHPLHPCVVVCPVDTVILFQRDLVTQASVFQLGYPAALVLRVDSWQPGGQS